MPAMRTRLRARASHPRGRSRRGSALVEAALVLPVCLLFIFGVLEYGRYLMMLHLLNNAAREGARYAVSHTQSIVLDGVSYGSATADVVDTVDRYLVGNRLINQVTSVYLSDSNGNNIGNWNDASSGQSICVRITGQFQWITPTLLQLPSQSNVQVQSIMRTEGN